MNATSLNFNATLEKQAGFSNLTPLIPLGGLEQLE